MAHGLGLIASRLGYEERRLLDVADRRNISVDIVDHRGRPFGVCEQTPAVAINREISSEKAVWMAATLEATGARVLNASSPHRLASDKWLTHVRMDVSNLPVPTTFSASSEESLRLAVRQVGQPCVLKHRNGSWGRNVVLAGSEETALDMFRLMSQQPGSGSDIVLVQEFIPDAVDLRALVVGGKCLGTYRRLGSQWRQNVSLGSQPVAFDADPALYALATKAAAAIGLDVCGVDILLRKDAQPVVLEINSRVEYKGFEAVYGAVVAESILDYSAELLESRSQ